MSKKFKNDPKIESKSKVIVEGTIENKKLITTWVDPKTDLKPYPDPKNSQLGPQTFKNDPKNKSKSKIQIEVIIENKSCSTTWVDPKTVF